MAHLALADALTEVDAVARVAKELEFKEGGSCEVPEIRVHHPDIRQSLTSEIVHMLKHHAANNETNRHSKTISV